MNTVKKTDVTKKVNQTLEEEAYNRIAKEREATKEERREASRRRPPVWAAEE